MKIVKLGNVLRQKKTKFLLFILLFMTVFSVRMFTFAQSDETIAIYTAQDLIDISNAIHLQESASSVTIELKQDIVFDDSLSGYIPIGSEQVPFTGAFEGNGYQISNLTIKSTSDYTGLFGYVEKEAVITDVVLHNVNISGSQYVGAIAGLNKGTLAGVSIRSGTVIATGNYVGGLIGYNTGKFSQSSNQANIHGSLSYVGGLIGYNTGTVSESYNSGSVVGDNSSVGGLIGLNTGKLSVAYNTGVVKSQKNSNGYSYAGGVVGFSSADITDVYNTGNVSGSGSHVGGIAGMTQNATITTSYSSAYLSGSENVGGVVGYVNATGKTLTLTGDYYNSDYYSGAAVGGTAGTVQSSAKALTRADFYSATALTNEMSALNGNSQWSKRTNETGVYAYNPELKLFANASDTVIANDSLRSVQIETFTKISTAKELYDFATQVNNGNGYAGIVVRLSQSLDLSTYQWNPIGTQKNPFKGTFDGNGYTISGLHVDTSVSYAGLFGVLSNTSKVQNLGVESSQVNGKDFVGIIAGYNAGTLTQVYTVNSTLTGQNYNGGLVGHNAGIITQSYNLSKVISTGSQVGGITGQNNKTITQSYNTGSITGVHNVGGIAGFSYSNITNTYNRGIINGSGNQVGGIVGYQSDSIVSYSFNSSYVYGASNVGGSIGYIYTSTTGTGAGSFGINTSYYNSDLFLGSGVGSRRTSYAQASTTARTNKQMYSDTTLTSEMSALNGNKVWSKRISSVDNAYYPELTVFNTHVDEIYSEASKASTAVSITRYLATTADLKSFADAINAGDSYAGITVYLTANISLKNIDNWVSIGKGASTPFQGTFDGQGYTISGLKQNNTASYSGLFGYVGASATLKNFFINQANITGKDYTGMVAGYSAGVITNAYVTLGTLSGQNAVGGLVGHNTGSISQSYNTATVLASGSQVGGLVGQNNKTVTQSFNTGKVTGVSNVGGIVGFSYSSVNNVYNRGIIRGTGSQVGGIVGYLSDAVVSYSFNSSYVYGVANVGGSVGYIYTSTTGTGAGSYGINTSYYNSDLFLKGGIGSVRTSYTQQGTTARTNKQIYSDTALTSELSALNGSKVWSKRPSTTDFSYYPELTIFYNSTSNVVSNQSQSSTSISTTRYVTTAAELQSLANEINAGDSYAGITIYLMNNISLKNIENWSPIGKLAATPFQGTFDGQGFTIADMIQTNTAAYSGLFGYIGASGTVKNFIVENATIKGVDFSGVISGYNAGKISLVSTRNGSISGQNYVAGLVGHNAGSITQSYNTATITATGSQVGGLVGQNNGSVTQGYNDANVTGVSNIGGIVGFSYSAVNNVYNRGIIRGSGNQVGGIVGYLSDAVVSYSFNSSYVYGASNVGGSIGYIYTSTTGTGAGSFGINTSYFNSDLFLGGGIGSVRTSYTQQGTTARTNKQMYSDTALSSEMSALSASKLWSKRDKTDINNYYPELNVFFNSNNSAIVEESTQSVQIESQRYIYTALDFEQFMKNINGGDSYAGITVYLMNDISLKSISNWTPIGNKAATPFQGTFDGQGFEISDITQTVTSTYSGLFGFTGASGTIKNVSVANSQFSGVDQAGIITGYNAGVVSNVFTIQSSLKGQSYVGGLVGYNVGTVTQSYNESSVTATGSQVGGLVGQNNKTLTQSYNTGDVIGVSNVAGIAGYSAGPVNNVYNRGIIRGTGSQVGGIVGYLSDAVVSYSFNASYVYGVTNVGGSIGYIYTSTTGTGAGSYGINNSYFNSDLFLNGGIGSVRTSYTQQGTTARTNKQMYSDTALTSEMSALNASKLWSKRTKTEIYNYYPELNVFFNQNREDINTDSLLSVQIETQRYIYTVSDFYQFMEDINSGDSYAGITVYLMNDLSLKGIENWTSIGSIASKPFQGTFDGQGNAITDLTQTNSAAYSGLFGYVGASATIKDLYVGNAVISGVDFSGLIAGYSAGTITGVYTSNGTLTGRNYVGGLVGHNAGIITKSYNTSKVSASGSQIGGITGQNNKTITISYNTGEVSGVSNVGGIAGYSYSTISNVYNRGSIKGSGSQIGGIVGYQSDSIVNYSYNSSTVTGVSNVGSSIGYIYTSTTGTGAGSYGINTSYYNSSLNGTGVGSRRTSYAQASTTARTTAQMTVDNTLTSNMSALVTSANVWTKTPNTEETVTYPQLIEFTNERKLDVSWSALPTTTSITYEQTLKEALLTGGTVVSSDTGEVVDGVITWLKPNDVPPAGTKTYLVTFEPTNRQYKTLSTLVELTVNQATPKDSEPEDLVVTYALNKTLADYKLPSGWTWTAPETEVVLGTIETTVEFTPKDEKNYTHKFATVNVTMIDTSLSGLQVTGENLHDYLADQETLFDKDVFSYDVIVPDQIETIDITAIREDETYDTTINVNGKVKGSSHQTLAYGANKLTVEVVYQTKVLYTYTLNIYRLNGQTDHTLTGIYDDDTTLLFTNGTGRIRQLTESITLYPVLGNTSGSLRLLDENNEVLSDNVLQTTGDVTQFTLEVVPEAAQLEYALVYDNKAEVTTYDYVVKKRSNNTELQSILIDGEEAFAEVDEDGNLLIEVDSQAKTIEVEVVADDPQATIEGYLSRYSFEVEVEKEALASGLVSSSMPFGFINASMNQSLPFAEVTTNSAGVATVNRWLTVTAEDGTQENKSLVISRSIDQDATLSSLTASVLGENLLTNFDPEVLEYNLGSIPYNDQAKLTVNMQTTSNQSSILSYIPKNAPINVGENIYDLKIQAEDEDYTLTYRIIITMLPNTDAQLVGGLNPDDTTTVDLGFDENNVHRYQVNVSYDVKQYGLNQLDYELPFGGIIQNASTINLTVGSNNYFRFSVLAQDEVHTQAYEVQVNRMLSTTASLASLDVKAASNASMDPAFMSEITDYSLVVNESDTSYTVSASAGNDGVVDPSTVGTFVLSGIDKIHVVRVYSQDESTYRDYKISIGKKKSDDTSLQTIKVNGEDLTARLAQSSTISLSYDYYQTNKAEFEVKTTDANAIVRINNTKQLSFDLGEVSTTYTITITAQNGDQKEYKVTINRGERYNNLLKSLQIDHGSLSPVFDPATSTYTVQLTDDVTSVNISAVPQDSVAKVTGAGNVLIPSGETVRDITVLSGSGSLRTYSIKFVRSASSDVGIKDIVITGLTPSLCATNDEYCKWDPAFSADNYSGSENEVPYYITVPARIRSIEVTVVKGHAYQQITGEGIYPLNDKENFITVLVDSEDGNTDNSVSYMITVVRDTDGNADLADISFTSPRRDIEFDMDVTEYYVSVPNEYENYEDLNIEALKLDKNANLEINHPDQLALGMNTIEYVVTSADRTTTKTYLVHVYREESSDSSLASLTVNANGQKVDLLPKFNTMFSTYKATVANDVNQVVISGSSTNPTAQVLGLGTKDLKVGVNNFNISVTAQDDSVHIYTLSIVRQASADASITALTLNGVPIEGFDPEVLNYSIVAPATVVIPTFGVTLSDTNAKYTISSKTIRQFVVGVNTVDIRVTAQDGTIKTYHLTINREISSDARLSTVKTNLVDLTDIFNPDTTTYDLSVIYTEDPLTISATPVHSLTQVKKTGSFYLQTGLNVIQIEGIAEDGTSQIYTFNITMQTNRNASLKSLTTNQGALDPLYDSSTHEYFLNVDHQVDIINLEAIPLFSSTTITGNGPQTLKVGENTFTITTTSAADTHETYTVRIVRDASNNDNLDFLIVKEGALNREFASNILNYEVNVPYGTKKINVITETEDETATVTLLNNNNLKPGINTVTVRVTPGNQTGYKDYVLKVNVQAQEVVNLNLIGLKTTPGTLTPNFEVNTQLYTVEVKNEVTSIDVSATTAVAGVTVTGTGTYALDDLRTVIVVTTHDGQGVTRDYQIVVYRLPSDNAQLSALSLSGLYRTNYRFNKNTYTYNVTTQNLSLGISAVTANAKATYEILGNKEFISGESNKVTIRVTAEDKVTTKDYVVNVNRLASDNNYLQGLSISGMTFTPSFTAKKQVYTASVDEFTNQVVVSAIPQHAKAKVISKSVYQLVAGKNYIDVVVQSETGANRTYTVVVTKAGSSNNALKSLIVDGVSVDDFDPETTHYALQVPYKSASVTLSGTTENQQATISGLGVKNLSVGSNFLSVLVTAENGDIKTYTIEIIRIANNSAELSELAVKNYPFDETFSPQQTTYDITVDNEVTSLDLHYVADDENAEVSISGNQNFILGNNQVTIRVISSKKDLEKTYTINVYRQPYANTYLSSLSVSEGVLTPAFTKTTLEYKVNVTSDVSSITLDAATEISGMTLTGTGIYNLAYGDNRLVVSVTSSSGVVRKYHVVVNRSYKNDNSLLNLSLVVNGVNTSYTPTFNEAELSYEATVPVGTTSVVLSGNHNGASVSGLGTRTIHVGTNVLDLVVTSESGLTRTYQLTITRPASNVKTLEGLNPSSGILSPNFISSEYDYTLTLDSSVAMLRFDVTKTSSLSSVIGHEYEEVEGSESVRRIQVKAEDGTYNYYTIKVVRPEQDVTALTSLAVKGYTFDQNFDPETYTYTLTVPSTKKTLTADEIEYTLADPNINIELTGTLNLSSAQENIYEVKATAVDGLTVQTYRIIVQRPASTNSSLQTLTFRYGSLNVPFQSNVYEYTLNLPSKYKSFDPGFIKKIVAADSDAKIVYDPSTSIALEEGKTKPFKIVVTSEDQSSTSTYTFNVSYALSSDNYLSSILIDESSFAPIFNPVTQTYDVYVLENRSSIVVRAYPRDVNARVVSVMGEKQLTATETEIIIKVEAEDKTTREYTLNVKRTLTRDMSLSDVKLNNAGNAKLSPSFSNDVTQYTSSVTREYNEIGLLVTKGHPSQTVKVYDDDDKLVDIQAIPLKIGENTIRLEVSNGIGDVKNFYIRVERIGSGDNQLSALSMIEPETNNFVFVPGQREYFVNVANEVTAVDFAYETSHQYATVEVINNTHLVEGENEVIVRVTSENGEARDYLVHVNRLPQYNNYLKTITVSANGLVIREGADFSPSFNRTLRNYTVYVSSATQTVTVEGVPEVNTTTVVGDSPQKINTTTHGVEIDLKGGNNLVQLISTDTITGTVAIYQVNVIRSMSDDVTLNGLIARRGDNAQELPFVEGVFDSARMTYTVNVESNVKDLALIASAKNPNAKVVIRGNTNLTSGVNRATVTVTSEDRSKSKTYYITINKGVSSDNNLAELGLVENNILTAFDVNQADKNYTYTVNQSTSTIAINATTSDLGASVSGTGEYALNYGQTTIPVVVTAADKSQQTYTIVVNRPYDLRLSKLTTTHGTLSPVFDKDHLNYTVEVDVSVSQIALMGYAISSPLTEVSNTGWHTLNYGSNIIPITVTAPDNTSLTYTVEVIRAASSDNTLKSLALSEGLLDPEFTPEQTSYTTYISDLHQSVNLTVELNSPKATYEILGYTTVDNGDGSVLVQGIQAKEQQITIRVTAEDKTTKDYTIQVIRQDAALFSNKLASLSISPIKGMSPVFNPNTTRYVVTVDESITSLNIQATTQSYTAVIVSGVGSFDVNPGRNTYKIIVRSKDGVTLTYEVIVNQVKSSNAKLSSVSFAEGTLSPIFNGNTENYTMYVPANIEVLTPTIVPEVALTTWTVTGGGIDQSLVLGENTVTITATAQNGTAKKTYTIKVFKSANTSINLNELTSNTGSFDREFSRDDTGPYTLSIAESVNSILLTAIPEDPDAVASISGAGVISMVGVQSKTVNIVVHGVAGNTKTYTVIIQKSESTNTLLKALSIFPGELTPEFIVGVNAYSAKVENDIEKVEITAVAANSTALVTGAGVKSLSVGVNQFDIFVTSSSGSVGVYDVDITREAAVSSKIKSLSFNEGLIENPSFDPDSEQYTVNVPNEVTSLSIASIVFEDPDNTTYEWIGNSNFKVGQNTVQIKTTNHVDQSESLYTFTVNRAVWSSNFLKSLSSDKGDLTPNFSANQLAYTISVPYEVTSITLSGEVDDQTSTISGVGVVNPLVVGINELKVVVTSATNVSRTYIVRVTRLPSSDASLSDLVINTGTLDRPFDSADSGPYSIEVGVNTPTIEFSGHIPEGATVEGLGPVTLGPGTTTHVITVTAADGTTKTYTFEITRPRDSDLTIIDLIPSSGNLDQPFDNAINTYTMSVPDSTANIGFTVKTNSPNAIVSGANLQQLSYGKNTIQLIITAEDGTLRTITVEVTRQRDIEKIEVSDSAIALNLNETKVITTTITPSDASDQRLVWTSIDPSIATVDQDGTITAVGIGGTIVEVASAANPNIKAQIIVEVRLLALSSDTLDIVRISETETRAISDYVMGSEPQTTIDDYLKAYNNDRGLLHVFDQAGNEIVDLSQLVATKMSIKLIYNNVVYDELIIVVKGDLNGDGIVDLIDDSLLFNKVLYDEELEDIILVAADINEDNKVDLLDSSSLYNYVLGILESLN